MTLRVTPGETPTIEYTNDDGTVLWQIQADSVVILAEYTNPSGPWQDDYFLVFVFRDQGRHFVRAVSFYDAGTGGALEHLSKLWKEDLHFGLCNSTDWKSRVIWPRELTNRNYFTFSEVPPRSIYERLRRLCLGAVYEYYPSAEVRAYLDRCGGAATAQ